MPRLLGPRSQKRLGASATLRSEATQRHDTEMPQLGSSAAKRCSSASEAHRPLLTANTLHIESLTHKRHVPCLTWFQAAFLTPDVATEKGATIQQSPSVRCVSCVGT